MSEKKIKKVLVTGGAGYVGSVLVRKLLNEGYEVVVFDNLEQGRHGIEDIIDDILLIEKDLVEVARSRIGIMKLAKTIKEVDAVVHLAALSKEPKSRYSNSYCTDLNYEATRRVGMMCDQLNTKLIYASTCSTYFSYEIPDGKPKEYGEDDKLNPISPYAITKKAGEEVLEDAVIFRQGTIYGVSPRMRFDLVVNTIVKYAFHEGEVWAKENVWRPLVDIQTVTDAYMEALETDKKGIYNVVDFNIELPDLARQIVDILPKDVKIDIKKPKLDRSYVASKIKFDKRFDIEKRPFEDAVMEIWEFLEENPEDKDIYYNR